MGEERDTQLAERAQSLETQARALVVVTQADAEAANEFRRGCAALRKEIVDFFKPMKKKADEAHAEICAQEKSKLGPVATAEKLAADLLAKWQARQNQLALEARIEAERVAREETAKLQAQVEEKALAAAMRMEEAGDKAGAEAMLTMDLTVPQQKAEAPKAAKLEGFSTREVWSAEVDNALIVPREYLLVDQSKLDAVAKALKKGFAVPGCRAVVKHTPVGR